MHVVHAFTTPSIHVMHTSPCEACSGSISCVLPSTLLPVPAHTPFIHLLPVPAHTPFIYLLPVPAHTLFIHLLT
jgi:hypothetical protein